MNLEVAKQIIAAQGWSSVEKARRETGKLYLYAARRSREPGKKLLWRYIGPLAKLETMTEAEITTKLNKQ